jgi:hypothetical protein
MGGGNSAHCFFGALIDVIPFVRLIAVMHQKKMFTRRRGGRGEEKELRELRVSA